MKTYLFDFDGTLVDSMPTYGALMLRILDENGIAYGDDIIKIITPLGFVGTADYFIGMGLDKPRDEIVAKMREYATEEYTYNIPAKDGVIETLRLLKARGADLNVLTASPHTSLDPCLKRLGIFDIFTNVWSCEDFGTTKADPDIYVAAAERMGVAVGDVLFVDDNLGADKTAKSAGMKVCGIYDDSSREYVEEMKVETDFYVFNFADIAEI
ncbi:MAG: HAD family phosphatase [Clostridia bacterium]|nr:HAD family phosphatase [Clostridia bacterium]